MRPLLIAALVTLFAFSAGPAPVAAQPAPVLQTAAPANGQVSPIMVGLGAIAGVVAYNVATVGVSGVPLLARTAMARGVTATTASIATNRFYTVASAVVGAWVFNWMAGN